MLILNRKVGEQIRIGGNTEVTVLRIQGERVRLGFSAPKDVRICRQELSGATRAETDRPVSRP
jgi:carbon storage regulator